MIQVHGLSKRYGQTMAVDDLTFEVRPGHVTGFLGISSKKDAPAAIGDAHQVVVTGVDVESLAGQGAGPDVHDNGEAFARDGVEHFLHQDEPLAGGEIDRAPSGD